ncbi:group II intron maturase-specific domain-containing protein [Wolbachia pipientis]
MCAKRAFNKIDHEIMCALWKWAKKRHPRKGLRWIKNPTCMTPICSYSCFSRLPYFATHLNRYPFWRDTNNSCERYKFSPYTFQA